MLYVYTGTDREKARAEMNKEIARVVKEAVRVRITDASPTADLRSVLQGSGMFGERQVVVFDGVFANEEMRSVVLEALPHMKEADEMFFVLEGKLDASTRKMLEKHAETFERFDAKPGSGGKDRGEIFSLAYSLKRGDKKALWVNYQRALSRGERAEAIHGVLFWGAKDMYLKSQGVQRERAERLVVELAELPHEARRRGFELEYALEHYMLGVNKS